MLWEKAEQIDTNKCEDIKCYLAAIAKHEAINERNKIRPHVEWDENVIGNSAKVFADIENHARKIIGLDMEAYSVFVAAERTISRNKPKALVIKAVQDYADDSKAGLTPEQKADVSKYTEYGSFASAMFFMHACENFLISEIRDS